MKNIGPIKTEKMLIDILNIFESKGMEWRSGDKPTKKSLVMRQTKKLPIHLSYEQKFGFTRADEMDEDNMEDNISPSEFKKNHSSMEVEESIDTFENMDKLFDSLKGLSEEVEESQKTEFSRLQRYIGKFVGSFIFLVVFGAFQNVAYGFQGSTADLYIDLVLSVLFVIITELINGKS